MKVPKTEKPDSAPTSPIGHQRKDILLVTINAKWIHPALSLRLLKANLGILQDRCSILEFALRQPMEEKIAPILEARPAILALSVSIWNHRATLELLDALAACPLPEGWSKPCIIMGGPEIANLDPLTPLALRADWIIRGEGELSFAGLCTAILSGRPFCPAPEIASVCGKIVESTPVDLPTINTGYALYDAMDLAKKLTYVESSRGCPFGCEFCLSSLDRRVRDFPLEAFFQDMEILIHRGCSKFKFLDRSINIDPGRAEKILAFFLEHLPPGGFVHFEMVPTLFPSGLRELLEKFPSGSLRIEIGIQTLNPAVARRIGRASNPDLELETIAWLGRHTKAIVHADLIAGLPGEDLDSFARGFDLLHGAGPEEIQLGILKKLPGTSIGRHDQSCGMVYSDEPPYEVISTGFIGKAELDSVKNFARFWDLIVNRGHFEDLVPLIAPAREGTFFRFMHLAAELQVFFGKNWGIDRSRLREKLQSVISEEISR